MAAELPEVFCPQTIFHTVYIRLFHIYHLTGIAAWLRLHYRHLSIQHILPREGGGEMRSGFHTVLEYMPTYDLCGLQLATGIGGWVSITNVCVAIVSIWR